MIEVKEIDIVRRKNGTFTLRVNRALALATVQAKQPALLNATLNRIRERGYVHENSNWVEIPSA